MTFLQLHHVSKGYGEGAARTEVLSNVHLSIEEGEFLAIVGYSGSGKTTLISLLAGLLTPDAGTVTLRGEVVHEAGPDRAVVFQNYSLLPWLTVEENVALAVDQVHADWPKPARRAHVRNHIETVHLSHASFKRPHELSGGMRQRVAVARALAMDPAVLLLDEPLSALDALTRSNLQEEFVTLWEQEQKTVVMVTNDVDEAVLLADRVIPLTPGPRATLGPSFPIHLTRPRDRDKLNHDPEFRRVRNAIVACLTEMRGTDLARAHAAAVSRKPPSLRPVDLRGPFVNH
jgi:nitrate/nitrite transport system ATP-binding protein